MVAFGFVAEAPIVGQTGSGFPPVVTKTDKSYVVIGSITRNIFHTPRSSACRIEKKSNYSNIVVPLSNRYGVDWRLITAIMAAESGFNPCAVSPRGAVGLMQITPDLAAEYQLRGRDMFDPTKNVRAGILHVRRLSKIYNGDLELTVAAYNAGEGNVARFGGIPPFKETQNYVKKVLGYHSDLEVGNAALAGSPMALLRTR